MTFDTRPFKWKMNYKIFSLRWNNDLLIFSTFFYILVNMHIIVRTHEAINILIWIVTVTQTKCSMHDMRVYAIQCHISQCQWDDCQNSSIQNKCQISSFCCCECVTLYILAVISTCDVGLRTINFTHILPQRCGTFWILSNFHRRNFRCCCCRRAIIGIWPSARVVRFHSSVLFRYVCVCVRYFAKVTKKKIERHESQRKKNVNIEREKSGYRLPKRDNLVRFVFLESFGCQL